jgi:hypothetical protein
VGGSIVNDRIYVQLEVIDLREERDVEES